MFCEIGFHISPVGLGELLKPVFLGLGGFADLGLEFSLAAGDFLLLQLDTLRPLNDLDLNGLDLVRGAEVVQGGPGHGHDLGWVDREQGVAELLSVGQEFSVGF